MKLTQTFGRNVRNKRLSMDMTLEVLASDVGLSYSYVGEIERGRRNPTLAVVERIAKVLGTAPVTLLTNND